MHEHVNVMVNPSYWNANSLDKLDSGREKNSDHFEMIPYYNSFLELLPEWLRPCMSISIS